MRVVGHETITAVVSISNGNS